MRRPNGYICPKCKCNNKYWLTEHKLIHCAGCGYQASVTGGTIFHGTRKPLLLWFHIMWWVVAQKTGASANNLMDFMGFGSYETAWSWLQKRRRGKLFYRLMQQAVDTSPKPFKELIKQAYNTPQY